MDKKNKEITIRELLNPYLKNWKYFVGTVIVMLVLALYFIKSKAPVYRSQTTVLIKDAKKTPSGAGDIGILQSIGGFSGMGTSNIENEIGVFQSKTLVEEVLKENNFQISLYAKQTLKSIELFGKTNPFVFNIVKEKEGVDLPKKPIHIKSEGEKITLSSKEWDQDIVTTYNKTVSLPFAIIIITKNKIYAPQKKVNLDNLYFFYTSFENAVNSYQNQLEVDLLDKLGTIITLSVDFENKDKAKVFLNGMVDKYNYYAINDKNIESKKTKDFIDKRIKIISQELGDVETKKEDFKVVNNIVDLGTEARLSLQNKEQSKLQILEIGTQLELNRILQSTLNKKGVSDVLPLNIGLENESTSKVIQQYNELVLQRTKYLENATPNNPLIKEFTYQIEQMKSSLSQALQRNITSLELAKRKSENLLGGSEVNIGKVPNQEKLFRSIERQQQIKESLYLLLLQKREEAAINLEITADKARVIDKAFVYSKPVAPKKIYLLGFAIFLGILVPFGIIYLKQLLQTKVVTRSDISDLTENPIIAEIPKLRSRESQLVSFNDITSMAEAFRILLTNLKFLLPSKETNVIMVTSSVKGEGKTFISTNLSILLASQKNKVLVIGADVRNPQLQRYSPSLANVKGLSDFLSGDDSNINEIIRSSENNDNCDFIYSGPIPPNPTELLENGRLDDLLLKIKDLNKYKYIVLDTAPLMLVTDSFLIANKADVIVYVTRSEITEKSYLEFLNNSIKENKLKNVGVVLNGVDDSNFGYGNKFGYGYHSNEKKWWQKLF